MCSPSSAFNCAAPGPSKFEEAPGIFSFGATPNLFFPSCRLHTDTSSFPRRNGRPGDLQPQLVLALQSLSLTAARFRVEKPAKAFMGPQASPQTEAIALFLKQHESVKTYENIPLDAPDCWNYLYCSLHFFFGLTRPPGLQNGCLGSLDVSQLACDFAANISRENIIKFMCWVKTTAPWGTSSSNLPPIKSTHFIPDPRVRT